MTENVKIPACGGLLAQRCLPVVSSLFAFAVAFGFCVVALPRGFEITDEAYYLLMAMHPQSVQLYVSAQHWVTAHLWAITGSLAAFRACGLILLAGSALVLAHGVFKAFSRHEPAFEAGVASRFTVGSASIVFALLYASTINLSPCYNLLASAGANAAAGFVLLGQSALGNPRRHGLNLLAGLAVAVEFVSKPSSGIATMAVLGLWLLLLGPRPLKAKLADGALVASGAALGVLALVATQTSLADVGVSLRRGLDLFQMVQTESVGARLGRYALEFARAALEAIVSFGFVIAALFGYLATRHRLWLGAVGAATIATMVGGDFLVGGADQYSKQVGSSFVLLAMILWLTLHLWKLRRMSAILVGGLVALPYSVAVGTGNSIFTQVIISLAPWGALVAVFVHMRLARKSDKALVVLMFVVLVTSVSAQILTSGFRMPYHMSQPVAAQTEHFQVRDLGHVIGDAGTRRFVADMEAAVEKCAIPLRAPFLGLYNVPGVALTMGAVPYMTPWLNNLAQAEAVVRQAPPEVLQLPVLAIRLEDDGGVPQLPSGFADFKSRFRYCGEGTYPFHMQRVQIWYGLR